MGWDGEGLQSQVRSMVQKSDSILTSRKWHEGRVLLEGLIGIQKMLGIELLRRLELFGVIVHGVKKRDDICVLCGGGGRVNVDLLRILLFSFYVSKCLPARR